MQSTTAIDRFFESLVINLNNECFGKSNPNIYKVGSNWKRENFVSSGRKFDIIDKGCLNGYGNNCSLCYGRIVKARTEFKELYLDELENRTKTLESQVKSLTERLDNMSEFVKTT